MFLLHLLKNPYNITAIMNPQIVFFFLIFHSESVTCSGLYSLLVISLIIPLMHIVSSHLSDSLCMHDIIHSFTLAV